MLTFTKGLELALEVVNVLIDRVQAMSAGFDEKIVGWRCQKRIGAL